METYLLSWYGIPEGSKRKQLQLCPWLSARKWWHQWDFSKKKKWLGLDWTKTREQQTCDSTLCGWPIGNTKIQRQRIKAASITLQRERSISASCIKAWEDDSPHILAQQSNAEPSYHMHGELISAAWWTAPHCESAFQKAVLKGAPEQPISALAPLSCCGWVTYGAGKEINANTWQTKWLSQKRKHRAGAAVGVQQRLGPMQDGHLLVCCFAQRLPWHRKLQTFPDLLKLFAKVRLNTSISHSWVLYLHGPVWHKKGRKNRERISKRKWKRDQSWI